MTRTKFLIAALTTPLLASGFAHADSLAVSSPDLAPGEQIKTEQVYSGSGCSGGNISPALTWSGAPAGTKSFAATLFDPDAPGGGFWHWLVFNIPATATGLAKGDGAATGKVGTQLVNGWGATGYGGPCPPTGGGAHGYVLTVYAVDQDALALPANAQPADLLVALNGHILAKATLTATYGR